MPAAFPFIITTVRTYLTATNIIWALALCPLPIILIVRTTIDPAFFLARFEPSVLPAIAYITFFSALFYTPRMAYKTTLARRRLQRHECTACGYNLSGHLEADGEQCPECGEAIPPWRLFAYRNRTQR